MDNKSKSATEVAKVKELPFTAKAYLREKDGKQSIETIMDNPFSNKMLDNVLKLAFEKADKTNRFGFKEDHTAGRKRQGKWNASIYESLEEVKEHKEKGYVSLTGKFTYNVTLYNGSDIEFVNIMLDNPYESINKGKPLKVYIKDFTLAGTFETHAQKKLELVRVVIKN